MFLNRIVNIIDIFTCWIPIKKYRKKIKRKIFTYIYQKNTKKSLIYADISISLGEYCRVAWYLSEYNLRKFSSPFDWMMHYKLKDIQEIFHNDFTTFFKNIKENKKYNASHRYIQDLNNGMVSIHDFDRDKSIESQYKEFINKMQKRFNRLKSSIINSKNILFVTHRNIDINEFKDFLFFMYNYHNANYTILNIRNDTKQSILDTPKQKILKLNNNLSIIEYSFNDNTPLEYIINTLKQNGWGVTQTNYNNIYISNKKGKIQVFLKTKLYKIPLFMEINQHGNEEWVGNYIQWNKIMLLIDLNKDK